LRSFSQLKEELEKMGYSKKTRKEITGWYEPHEKHQGKKKNQVR
jgi:hypothetical protein